MKKLILTISFSFLLYFSSLFSQNFQTSVLVDLPDSNFNIDVSKSIFDEGKSYISWINKKDSTYTVYLKFLSDVNTENIIIASDSNIKANSEIAFNDSDNINICWENFNGNYWQILGCFYYPKSKTVGEKIIIRDSLQNRPQISLSNTKLVWIENDHLYIGNIIPQLSAIQIIDSNKCSNPNIRKYIFRGYIEIVYEKEKDGKHSIWEAIYDVNPYPNWSYNVLSNGSENLNPKLGDIGICFQSFINGYWKVIYTPYINFPFDTTLNENCNFQNPSIFSFPIITNSVFQFSDETPFFVAFDSDSIENNKEIFIKTFYFYNPKYDSLYIISNSEGDDSNPFITYCRLNDTFYVAILWEHNNGDDTEIWIAKDVFNPVMDIIKDKNTFVNIFYLNQNYPNPFNPITNINYEISQTNFVTLKVYDVLGQLIKTLVNEEKKSGSYSVTFDGSNFSSGMYFYQMKVGNFVQTKKMILLK